MKLKFYFTVFFLLFARGCDFYSTGLWFFEHPEGEQNLLYRLFHLNFTGLVLSNAVVMACIVYAYYYYLFRYKPQRLGEHAKNLLDFVSLKYYGKSGLFYRVFFRPPSDKCILLAHMGYVMMHFVVVASFIATAHNLCQYYRVGFYDQLREWIGRPLYLIYALMFLCFLYFQFRLWNKEYRAQSLVAE